MVSAVALVAAADAGRIGGSAAVDGRSSSATAARAAIGPSTRSEAYRLAAEMGADFIEPDLVSTKDGVLDRAARERDRRHDRRRRSKFPDRKTTKTIDGQAITGWFTEDFTLAEIKTLRAKERLRVPLARATTASSRSRRSTR